MSASAVKSVFVEIIKKDLEPSIRLVEKIKRGPFAGLFIRKKKKDGVESYVTLFSYENEKKALDIFNIEYYNIVTIEINMADHARHFFFKNTDKDQKEAFNKVADILAELQEAGRVLDDKSLVDLSTYKLDDITGLVAGKHVNNRTYGAKGTTGVVHRYTAPSRRTTTTTAKKEPTMKVIKRKRGCSKKLLAVMYKAVKSISDGTYEPPETPKAPKEDEAVTNAKTSTAGARATSKFADEDDDFYKNGGWYM